MTYLKWSGPDLVGAGAGADLSARDDKKLTPEDRRGRDQPNWQSAHRSPNVIIDIISKDPLRKALMVRRRGVDLNAIVATQQQKAR